MTEKEALKLALEALENTTPTGFNMERDKQFFAAITAIKEALAQPEQEPVAWRYRMPVEDGHWVWNYATYIDDPKDLRCEPLYTTPPQLEQEPVSFYVYKPTLPRGHLGNVSDGDLPWVYDQDPSSGYSARMLVYTTPPQLEPVIDKSAAIRIATSLGWEPKRKPLTDEEIKELYGDDDNFRMTKKYVISFARAIEAAHGIKENT